MLNVSSPTMKSQFNTCLNQMSNKQWPLCSHMQGRFEASEPRSSTEAVVMTRILHEALHLRVPATSLIGAAMPPRCRDTGSTNQGHACSHLCQTAGHHLGSLS